jgi:cytochrome P450
MASTFKFDPTSGDAFERAGQAYGELARHAKFYEMDNGRQKFWITSDYDEIRNHVLQDNPDWSFKWGNAAKDTAHDTGVVTDPPFHMAFRDVMLPGFTPRAVEQLRPRIESIAQELVGRMALETSGDLHDLFALPLPARVMCVMLGLPQEDYLHYKHWADTLQEMMFHDDTPGSHKGVFREIHGYFMGEIESRRDLLRNAGVTEPDASHVGTVLPDDHLSRSVVAKVEGRPLTDMELVNICVTYLTGGQETTTNLIGNCVWRLLQNPELWEQLCADPSLIRIAIEESLRFDPPVLAHFRTALHPVAMHGHDLPDHAKLMFSIAGANRDEARFSEPDTFRLDRPRKELGQHLSFGHGVHFCIGAPVARLEGQIALRLLTENFPKLRLDGPSERIDTWMYWGRKQLPVRWD